MESPFDPMTAEQLLAYNEALDLVKRKLGSFEAIAAEVYKRYDQQISGVTYSRWFRDKDVPTRIAIIFTELTGENEVLPGLCPFLHPYLLGYHCAGVNR